MARVLILGGGFAAVSAAETLAAAIGSEHEILLVSKSSEFTFFPAIVPLVFGDFALEEIRTDLRPKLAERNIQFVQGEVRGINTRLRTVDVSSDRIDSTIQYDYLLMAMGPRVAAEGVPGLFVHAHHLLTVDAALDFKEAIVEFESGAIVVGLCPEGSLPVPVCESALALGERFKLKIKTGDVSLTVVLPATLEKTFAGSALFRDIEKEFERKGIKLVTGFAVKQVDETQIFSESGASIGHDLLMLIPRFSSQLSVRSQRPMTDLSGFAKVNSFTQVEGLDKVYAAGDILSLPGPKFGYMAMRQGKVAAMNILAELRGEKPGTEYSHDLAWAIDEKYSDPIFFHYGFWDETLDDFDDNALFGMARKMRDRYGHMKLPEAENYLAAA